MTYAGPTRPRRTRWALLFGMLAFTAVPATGFAQARSSSDAHTEATLLGTKHSSSFTHRLECSVCAQSHTTAALQLNDERRTGSAHQSAPAAALTVQPRRPSNRRNNIGRTWRYSRGRVLNANLTPSPEHCAPQIELRF